MMLWLTVPINSVYVCVCACVCISVHVCACVCVCVCSRTCVILASRKKPLLFINICMCFSGARVILACRNETEGRAAAEEIRKETSNINVVFMKLDLSSFKSIRGFVEKFNESKSQSVKIISDHKSKREIYLDCNIRCYCGLPTKRGLFREFPLLLLL